MPAFEQFICNMFKMPECCSTDEARFQLMLHRGLPFDKLVPTSDAAKQHLKRASYVAGYVIANCFEKVPTTVPPADWAFIACGQFCYPVFTTLPIMSSNLPALVVCGCKVSCKPPCKCAAAKVACVPTCKCKGTCFKNNDNENWCLKCSSVESSYYACDTQITHLLSCSIIYSITLSLMVVGIRVAEQLSFKLSRLIPQGWLQMLTTRIISWLARTVHACGLWT